MNRIILIGRVGQDPAIKKFDNGGQVAQFSLATSSKWKNKEGERQERTEWHNIVISGKLSEVAEKYISKGMQLMIEGEVRYRDYEKDGVKRYFTEIFANSMEMLGSKEKSENSSQSTPQSTIPNAPMISDLPQMQGENDLPF